MFENLDDPRRQALLAMAAGLFSPVRGRGMSGFGEALGNGINAGLLGLNTATRTQEATRRGEMDRKLEQARLDQLKQAQEAQAYMGAGIGRFMNPGSPGVPYNDALGDGQQGFVKPPQAPSFDKQGFAQYLAQNPATAREALNFIPQPKDTKYMESAGRIVAIGPDGKAQEVLGAPPPKSKREVGDIRAYDVGRFKITEEWDGSKWIKKGSSAIDKPEDGSGFGKPPQGYRWKADGALEPIPGGPADAKVGKEAEAQAKRQEGALQRATSVLDATQEAIDKTGYFTAGIGSVGLRSIPGTPAYDLNRKVDEIKANIGFAELQAMREASPTGGALGQVAVQELNMLQSVLGSLDTGQSPPQLSRALEKVHRHYSNWKRAVEQSRQSQQPGTAPQGAPAVSINGLSITVNGQTLTFPSEAQLNAFKKQAGL